MIDPMKILKMAEVSAIILMILSFQTAGTSLAADVPVFRAEYRNGVARWSGSFAAEKFEEHIVHQWGHGGPDEVGYWSRWVDGTPSKDDYSIRWEGVFKFPAGKYEFFLSGDDHAWLFIDGKKAAEVNWDEYPDKWTVYDGSVHEGKIFKIDMTHGAHHIEFRFYEHMGAARAILDWRLVETKEKVVMNRDGRPARPLFASVINKKINRIGSKK